MTLKLYPTPAHFLQDNQEFLTQNPVSTQLNQGNASANQDSPCTPQLLFGRYESHGQPLLLFGNTAPRNLCLNAPQGRNQEAGQAAAALARYLQAEHIPIPGIMGRESLCQPFMEAWKGDFQLHTAMDIMILRTLIEPPNPGGQVRLARLEDLETIARWMCGFTQEALREPCQLSDRLDRDRQRIEEGRVWIMENKEGEPVSTAGTSRETPGGVSVSAVYTPPEHRGKGYCQNTVAGLCRRQFQQGKEYCTLFVDKSNPFSNRAYQKIGFQVLEDSSDYRLISSTELQ